MGADIHYAIEQEDENGQWHCLWSSSLYWSDWFYETILKPKNKTSIDDPYRLQSIKDRDYALFSLFSNVRGHCAFERLNPDWKNGILKKDWPSDLSKTMKPYSPDSNLDGYHSHGHILLKDLQQINDLLTKSLKQRKTRKMAIKQDEKHQASALTRFLTDLDIVITHFTGNKPVLGHFIGYIPDSERGLTNPNQILGKSAHDAIETTQAWLKRKPASPETLRLLIRYDS